MNEEELKKELKKEIINLCETNSSVMTYMECLMKSYEKLEKELDQYKNNWEELKKWLEDDLKEVYRDAGFRHKLILEVLDKMKELEEGK